GRSLAIALATAAVAIVVAIALSPIGLLGRARQFEPAGGIVIDGRVLAAGAGIIIVGLMLAGGLAAWLASAGRQRSRRVRGGARRGDLAAVIARSGGSPALVAGVGTALGPGRGHSALPMRQTMAGAALAVAVVATA